MDKPGWSGSQRIVLAVLIAAVMWGGCALFRRNDDHPLARNLGDKNVGRWEGVVGGLR